MILQFLLQFASETIFNNTTGTVRTFNTLYDKNVNDTVLLYIINNLIKYMWYEITNELI